ncbi:hypothetical protein GCM10011375_13790 [Hymenobacter qilianensis]|uniref:Uncharacterized protein n=1 Tax=Hymenobacter qilianensis TaxID=1385715 RepID=A0ACB5PPP3_9BACT|nr:MULTISPECIES: hypothetical protein [Hymenobacter]MBC6608605.1 hypothetical protein [Hymenobacter sp. BT188]GGF59897.1 hypothetical protein GCM10011375_13790 [Hymenobacter qilianensis]
MIFLRQFILFCLLLGGIFYALSSQFGTAVIHPLTIYVFGFFALLTLITYWVTSRLIRANPDNFMGAYFGSMVVRLLLSVGLVLVFLYNGGAQERPGLWTFLGGFFILYFLFAGFEIWSVLSNLRPFSKQG